MEEAFPRGGSVKKPTVQHQNEDEEDLFKVTGEAVDKGKKRKLKQEEKKKVKKQKVHVPDFLQGNEIEPLSFKALHPEMLCLGCLKEIRQYELIVGLPNGLTGTVAITNISDTYTQALRNYASKTAAAAEQEDIYGLHDLFKVGMLMLCKVLEPEPDQGGKKKKTRLTINPKDVHKNLSVKSIRSGMALFGVISSVEDHGYTVDIGVKGLHAFLKNTDAERYIQMHNDGYPLKAGQYVRCRMLGEGNRMDILSGEGRTVSVTINPKKVGKAQLNSSGVEVGQYPLLPGTRITVNVEKTCDEGIFVRFSTFKGQVHRSHLTSNPNNYSKNEEVVASILYIHPLTKVISMTLQPHLVNYTGVTLDLFKGISFGDIVEAKLKHFDGNNRAIFQLTESAIGFASKKNLCNNTVKDIKKEFQIGSLYRCRIMGFNPLENQVAVTLKQSILEQKYLRLADIKPGKIVQCTIKAIHSKGVSVKVVKGITGFIPTMHLTDVTLKNPEKKFKINDKLKCRVLFVNTQKKNLTLTHKKSLVHTKYPIITDYSQCQVGQELEGFILAITDKGVRVNFFNDVTLSSKAPFGQRKADVPSDFQIGKLVDCVVIQKGEKGLDVELQPSGKKAFLPKTHLSDSMAMCELLWDMYKEGSKIPQVMYYNRTSITIVSAKQSLIEASKSNELLPELSDLKLGMMYPGVVKNLVSYGVFVEFPGGLFALSPNKFAVDRRLPELSSVYTPGQTVVAKVTDIDIDNKRFLVSLRMTDCYQGDTSIGLRLLRNFLKQREAVIKKYRKKKNAKGRVAQIIPGSIVKVRVIESTEEGLVCQLDDGVRGFIFKDHMEDGTFDLEKDLECLVLVCDLVKLQVELSMKKNLISKVKSLKKNRYTQIKEGQGLKSEVLVIKEDFILVILRGHGAGQLAYLPSKRHLDDVLECHQFEVGQVNPLIIKEVRDNLVLASLKIHEEKEADDGDVIIKVRHEIEERNIKIGDIVTAKVKSVFPTQMNITVDDVPGRVHITQSVDEICNGLNPFRNYIEGMEIQVKVIGLKEIKSSRYLPITHRRFKKTIPECTLKPSLLAAKGDNFGTEEKKLSAGEKVVAFVEDYSANILWMHVTTNIKGKVHFFDISNDLRTLENPGMFFKPGNGYNATVIEVIDESLVQLTLTGSNIELKEGCITKGKIVGISEGLGLTVLLPHSYKGFVSLTDLQDEFRDSPVKAYHVGQVVKCCVLTMSAGNRCRISLRKSRLKPNQNLSDVKDPDIQCYSQLTHGQVLRGYITRKMPDQLVVSVGHDVPGFVQFKDSAEDYFPGKVVSVQIMSISEGKPMVKMSLLGLDVEERKDEKKVAQDKKKTVKRKRKSLLSDSESTLDSKRAKKEESAECAMTKSKDKKVGRSLSSGVNVSDTDSGVDIKQESDSEDDPKKPSFHSSDLPRLQLPVKFSWDADFKLKQIPRSQERSMDDSDEEEIQEAPKKTKEQIRLEKQEEEKRLFEFERKQLEGEQVPQTADAFDRLVLQSPNSSMVWLRYMAFHLETAEIDKARAVAERALKTISFREEQEKLNVWVAYLNLENMYGTPQSLSEVLKRAVQQNDSIKVHQHLINIYVSSGKIEEAEQVYNMLVKKHSQNKEIWISFEQFYFQNDRLESARRLLQRAFKSLDPKQHVEVIAKVSQMEFKHGDPERGKTMFENILSNYPKRTDLWSVYIDMETKQGNIENVRHLYERVISLKMSAKKMKFFFKKHLDFEQQHGTDATVAAVKQKALEFVESRGYVDADD
ncbi:hypothetical protein CHS0354_037678 [Potamilus streckersoni]|uniref:Protein RRP5 homolog n=1 Tax=Potamilus streckersoni TaxID=2493646 RepID=A0AAE0W440_9BIVA|nr:hypothetical protein CHS0354_037678 [Potamilus streckersoni]